MLFAIRIKTRVRLQHSLGRTVFAISIVIHPRQFIHKWASVLSATLAGSAKWSGGLTSASQMQSRTSIASENDTGRTASLRPTLGLACLYAARSMRYPSPVYFSLRD